MIDQNKAGISATHLTGSSSQHSSNHSSHRASNEEMCTQLLKRVDKEGKTFLQRIVTVDELWLPHYNPEIKGKLTEYKHKTSPGPWKSNYCVSASGRRSC